MADQDLNINVTSTADLAALREAEAEVKKFADAQAELKAQGGALGGTGAISQPVVSPELLERGEAFGAGKAGYEGLTHAAAEAERATRATANASLLLGMNLTRARTEAIILARELATGVPTMRTLSSLLGSLGIGFAGAAVTAFGVTQAILKANEQADKLNKQTSDLSQHLVDVNSKFEGLVTAARKPEDVLKVAESTLSELDKIQEKMTAAQEQTLGFGAQFVDSLRGSTIELGRLIAAMGGLKLPDVSATFLHPMQAVHDQSVKNAQELEEAAEADAVRRVKRAEDFTRQFKELEHLPLEDALQRLEQRLVSNTARAKNLLETGDIKSWIATQQTIAQINKDMVEIVKHAKDFNAETKKGAEELFKGPVTAAREAEQRQRQHAAFVAEARELAAEGLRPPVTPAEEQAFQLQEQLRKLQREQALQRSLLPQGEGFGGQAALKTLGPQGVLAAQERDRKIAEVLNQIAKSPLSQTADPADRAADKIINFMRSVWQ